MPHPLENVTAGAISSSSLPSSPKAHLTKLNMLLGLKGPFCKTVQKQSVMLLDIILNGPFLLLWWDAEIMLSENELRRQLAASLKMRGHLLECSNSPKRHSPLIALHYQTAMSEKWAHSAKRPLTVCDVCQFKQHIIFFCHNV